MNSAVDRCLWISPGEVTPQSPPTSAQRFAAAVADRCEVVVIGLHVWLMDFLQPYDLMTEVTAVQRAARDRGWSRYHLFGFSAGATVALATARADSDSVCSVALVNQPPSETTTGARPKSSGATICTESGDDRPTSGRLPSEDSS